MISILNIDTSNDFVAKKFVQKISNMNWIEKKFINGLSPDEIKKKLFYQDEEINKFNSNQESIFRENEDNQIIYLFQARKNIEEKIDIIKKIIDEYQDNPDKIESIVRFFHHQLEDLQLTMIDKERQLEQKIISTANKVEKKIIPPSRKTKLSDNSSEKQEINAQHILYIDTNFFADIARKEVVIFIKKRLFQIMQKIEGLFH